MLLSSSSVNASRRNHTPYAVVVQVGLGGGTASGSNAAPGTTANQSQEAAAAGGGSSEQSVPAASPELGAVVQDAEQRAVEVCDWLLVTSTLCLHASLAVLGLPTCWLHVGGC